MSKVISSETEVAIMGLVGRLYNGIFADEARSVIEQLRGAPEYVEPSTVENRDDDTDAFIRGVALALSEIHSGNSIETTLASCSIYSLDDLKDAGVSQFDIDRLDKYFD